MTFTGLKDVLRTFDQHGWKGSFTRGLWRIANGGYDCWFELYYKELPVAQCIVGTLECNYTWVSDAEKEKMFDKILEVFDHLKVCEKPSLYSLYTKAVKRQNQQQMGINRDLEKGVTDKGERSL